MVGADGTGSEDQESGTRVNPQLLVNPDSYCIKPAKFGLEINFGISQILPSWDHWLILRAGDCERALFCLTFFFVVHNVVLEQPFHKQESFTVQAAFFSEKVER